jgi:hypothetical protein
MNDLTDRKLEQMLRGLERPEVPEDLRARLIGDIPPEFRFRPRRSLRIGGRIMKATFAAASILAAVAVTLFLIVQSHRISLAYALTPVVETLEQATGLHFVGAVRSRPGEPFDYIAVDVPLQDQEIWIEAGPYGPTRMRLEKPDRLFTFDGETTLFVNRRTAEYAESPGGHVPDHLLDPQMWLRRLIDRYGDEVKIETRETADGRDIEATVLETGVPVEGREPAFWNEFDRRTEIRWDRDSNRLLEMRRFVETGRRDLLVAEIHRVEYFDTLDGDLFRAEIPAGAGRIEVIEAGEEYNRLGPAEVARVFWTAAAAGNWDRLRIFCPSPALIDSFKDNRPIEILDIGEPFRTGGYIGWYVPYRVRFADGSEKGHNLALRNDNAWGRYVYDGGI